LVGGFVLGMPSRRTNNFPESGRGLGHVTPTIFGIPSNISLKLLELESSYLIHGFVWAMPNRRTYNFPWKGAWPRWPIQFLAVRSAILATAWLLVDYDESSRRHYRTQCWVRRRRLCVTLCIVAKRCVIEQKLLSTAYRKSYMRSRLFPKWMTLTFV